MTAFLAATLLALVVGGALLVVWREHREWFRRALAAAGGLFLLIALYVWAVMHGHEVLGDPGSVVFSELHVSEVAGSFRVTGRIANGSSEYNVSAVPLTLLIEECGGTPPACETLREVDQPLVISLAPGEARQFSLVFSTPVVAHKGPLRFRLAHEGPRTHQAVLR